MGQAPKEVQLAATDVTASVTDDGVAQILSGLEGILFSRSEAKARTYHDGIH
jgi:hypothetical protein